MPSTYESLRADIVAAVKARDSTRATRLRTADAAIQRASLDQGKPIDEALVTATLRKLVKNLTDAKAEFEKGGRADLAAANAEEIGLFERYLPQGLSPAQMEALVVEAIQSSGATTRKEMGKVMAQLKQHPSAELIDFGAASKLIQGKLS